MLDESTLRGNRHPWMQTALRCVRGGYPVRKIGIVGGERWPITAHYYAEICRACEARETRGKQSASIPEVTIEALDWRRVASLEGDEVDEESWRSFDAYHALALERLATSAAALAVITSNAAHERLTNLRARARLSIVDPFEVLAECCARLGSKQVLMLGPFSTMVSRRLRQVCKERGVEIDCPADAVARAEVVALIDTLESRSTFNAADTIRSLALKAFTRRFLGRPVVGLGCAELAFAFPRHKSQAIFEVAGITYINATAAYIDAALDLALAG
jgi:aspartate/glutamate racemase